MYVYIHFHKINFLSYHLHWSSLNNADLYLYMYNVHVVPKSRRLETDFISLMQKNRRYWHCYNLLRYYAWMYMYIICIINFFYRFIRDLVFRRYSRRESRAWSTSRSKVPVWTGPRWREPVSSTGRTIGSTGRSHHQCLSYWWGKNIKIAVYRSVLGKCPLLGKRPCTAFQGATVAASIQTYGILIPGKRPFGPKSRVMYV